MSHRIFRVPPVIRVGEGAAACAGEEAKNMGAAKALVITDSFLAKSGTIKPRSLALCRLSERAARVGL